jgi:hypothetical protein
MKDNRRYKVRLFYNDTITIGLKETTMSGRAEIRIVNGETATELVRQNMKNCRKVIIEVKDEN